MTKKRDDDTQVVVRRSSGPIPAVDTFPKAAYLIVITGPQVGEMFRVEDEVTIGRSSQASITLVGEGISREHCSVRALATGEVLLRDLKSTNGTFINDSEVREGRLGDGDKIHIGATTILKFTYHDELDQHFQHQMYHSALRDGLTGAFNRRYFRDRLVSEFAFAFRHKTPLTLCVLDLDHFKRVNDTYGHLAGDHVLQSITDRFGDTLRKEDVFARYGGEEFVVLSRGISRENSKILAERVRAAVEAHPFVWDDTRIPVTISIGVASMPDARIKEPDDLITLADKALYEAKAGGRNRVVVMEPVR